MKLDPIELACKETDSEFASIIFRVLLLSDKINCGVLDTTNKSGAFGTLHEIRPNRACLQADRLDWV